MATPQPSPAAPSIDDLMAAANALPPDAPTLPVPPIPPAAQPAAPSVNDLLAAANALPNAAPGPIAGPIAQGVRDVAQGAMTLPGLVYDSLGNLINLGERGIEGLTGADLAGLRVHPAAQNIDDLLTSAGLPKGAAQPDWQSRMIRALSAPLGGGAVGGVLSAVAPAGSVAAAVAPALTAAPLAQAVSSGATEAASLYTDDALKDHPLLAPFANAAAGLAAAGSYTGLANLLNAPGLPDEIAQWAAKARDYYKIPLAATDMSQNPLVRTAASINRNLLLSGAGAHDDAVASAFTRAVSNTIGQDSPRLTPDVMSNARTAIGNELDRIGGVTQIGADQPLVNDLGRIQSEARSVTGASATNTPPQMQAIQNQLSTVGNQFIANNGSLPGSVFQDMIKKGTPLDVTANNPDPVIARYGQQIRDSLWDAFERSAPPDEVSNLQNARLQWKNMKTIEPLVEKSPATGTPGLLSPALMMGAARSAFDDMSYSGAGALGDLGTIGQMFLRPVADSGTPLRTAVLGALMNPAAVIPSVAGGAALNYGLGKALRSDLLANRMLYGGAPIAPQAAGTVAASLLAPQGRGQ